MQKQIQFKVKGMQRDLSASAFNPEYAYENKNIRIMPTDESTLLSIVNEKGNKLANISGIGDSLKGVPIGQALINDELIIFTAGDNSLRVVGDITPTIDTVDDITSEEFTIDIDSNMNSNNINNEEENTSCGSMALLYLAQEYIGVSLILTINILLRLYPSMKTKK